MEVKKDKEGRTYLTDANQIRIGELSHDITFHFQKGQREFRLTIKTDINAEGKVTIEEMNDDQPILMATDCTNRNLYEKLIDQARDILFNVCQYADELADEYIK